VVGEGNGVEFSRLSRKNLLKAGPTGHILEDWFLQTRTLFRNRTGTELRRILIPEGDYPVCEPPAGYPVELKATPISGSRDRSPSIEAGLHHQAAGLAEDSEYDLSVPFLENRRRSYAWERRLRLGVCVLTGSWALLLVGACQNETLLPENYARQGEDLEQYAMRFNLYQKDWAESERRLAEVSRPFAVTGNLVRSIPEGVRMSGLKIRQSNDNAKHFEIEVNGAVPGESETGLLRSWIEGLKADGTLTTIGDVKFYRTKGRIAFTLTGSQKIGGHSK